MGRKFSILVALCVVLFGAILAGYWDMLDSQKFREVRDQASSSVAALTDPGSGNRPAKAPETPAAPAGSEAEKPAGKSADQAARSESVPTAIKPPTAGNAPATIAGRPPTLPSFDVLRVEPDGSAVLAGRAMPNSQVRLMDGANAIGSAKTSPEGDFAVVLGDRLPVGDHQIRIEADKGNGVKAISEQTAIVSVPKPGDGGELLAMVETPNQPSRIINLPTGRTPPQSEQAANPLPGAQPAPGDSPATGASTPTAGSAASSPVPNSETQTASREASPVEERPVADPPSAPSPFAVEAVEIENGTIYVAGRAPGTAPVRIYVDNKLVGEDRTRANDRFLVTAKLPLAVGDHRIRADMVGSDGAVASRVEVPFARPEGETMSAIASNDGSADRVPQPPEASAPSAPAQPAGTAETAPSAAGNTVRSAPPTAAPSGESDEVSPDVAARSPAVEPSLEASSPPAAAPNANPATGANPVPAVEPAPSTESVERPSLAQPRASADASPANPSTPPASRDATGAAALSQRETATGAEPSQTQGTEPPVAGNGDDADIATIRQPALEGVHARVLIRRGDTLWRISRQTYGQGRRYTVIYLANGDQIRNPNRIYPGQVFRLPKGEAKPAPTAVD